MAIALVIQRYGQEVTGGAESLARQIAVSLSHKLNCEVHVYTTCALDYRTWKNYYRPGIENINGIVVRRFKTSLPRIPVVFGFYSRLFSKFLRLAKKMPGLKILQGNLENVWYWLQGPVCPDLLVALKQESQQYQKIFIFTYIYELALQTMQIAQEKGVLIPTAHDEMAFYLEKTKELFKIAPLVLPSTAVEQQLIQKHYPFVRNIKVTGLGFDDIKVLPASKELDELIPYVLYLGRISKGKAVDQLIGYFLEFVKEFAPTNVKLVLAGKKEHDLSIPSHSHIKYLDHVSEQKKVELMSNAVCIINPSYFESLSMIVIEAMTIKKPILVNSHCQVLESYTKISESIFGFKTKEQFLNSLEIMLSTNWSESHNQRQLEIARSWAIDNYSWERVLKIYDQIIRGNI